MKKFFFTCLLNPPLVNDLYNLNIFQELQLARISRQNFLALLVKFLFRYNLNVFLLNFYVIGGVQESLNFFKNKVVFIFQYILLESSELTRVLDILLSTPYDIIDGFCEIILLEINGSFVDFCIRQTFVLIDVLSFD